MTTRSPFAFPLGELELVGVWSYLHYDEIMFKQSYHSSHILSFISKTTEESISHIQCNQPPIDGCNQ